MHLLTALKSHPLFATRESDYIRWYPKGLTPFPGGPLPTPMRPSGIYIHVPFCDRLCKFCPFNKRVTSPQAVNDYVEALLSELRLYGAQCESPGIEFVYFGGGSPSVLDAATMARLVAAIRAHFPLTSRAEITAECHPTHMSLAYACGLRAAGVTRVSMGIQSFDPACLERMGAQHTVEDGVAAIEAATSEFERVGIDILFRTAGQNEEHLLQQLDRAVCLEGINHISLYSLVLKDMRTLPDEDVEAQLTVAAHTFLLKAGFEHYASCANGGFDFARPGHQCQYEKQHWGAPQREFLGLGPGALGFVGRSVTVNGLKLDRYVASLRKERLPLVSVTTAGTEELERRYFVLGVKTLEVAFQPFVDAFGLDPRIRFQAQFDYLSGTGLATINESGLTLTALGRLFVDSVSALFFSAEQSSIPHPEEPEIRQLEAAHGGRGRQAEPVLAPV